MILKKKISLCFYVIIFFVISSTELIGENIIIAELQVSETAGLSRSLEYIEVQLQLKLDSDNSNQLNIVAEDLKTGEQTPCQVINRGIFEKEKVMLINVIFPSTFKAHERKTFSLKTVENKVTFVTDLKLSGNDLNLIIDNSFYRANLSKSNQSEAKVMIPASCATC